MAERNRTLKLSAEDRLRLLPKLVGTDNAQAVPQFIDALGDVSEPIDAVSDAFESNALVHHGDALELMSRMPDACVDLIFADPPYRGLRKTFHESSYHFSDDEGYGTWLETFLIEFKRVLKPDGSLYLCGDWRGAPVVQSLLEKHFILRNRITWEREKGRGASRNWKNSHEDIWFCTAGEQYHFHLERVKLLKQVRAPYRQEGAPKDWSDKGGVKRRLTHPSNCWTDLSVPFWSMRENTEHPTQKPEKLLARILLASSDRGQLVFDPFFGSGTTAAVARKLGRHVIGSELEQEYALLTLRRLELAGENRRIQGTVLGEQGYTFLERNASADLADGYRREE